MDHLQSMKVFVRVADLGSFARAANSMDISNAVATRHIADLEGRLGTRLLNRTTRSLSLTESGQVYLERARQILDELDDVEQMVVARNHEPVGSLRIVAPVVFGLHNLAPVLQTYAQRYPKVVPDVTLVDRQVDLVEEGFDVGIVIARQVRSASVVTRRLTTGCMTVCATPDYLATHGTPTRPEELLAHPCLSLPSEYWGDERVFTGPEGEVRVRPSNVIVANNTEMLRQFALLGMGIAILPSYLIGNDTTSGRFVRLLSDYRLPQVEINVAYPSRRHLPAKVRTFIDHLVEHFSQTPNHQLGEQWAKDGFAKPGAPVLDGKESAPLVAHAAYAHNGADEHRATATAARPVDGELGSKLAKPSRSRARMPAHSPY
ncbi:transcriptional regulator, LysR family [Caballeronia arationis]|uniref:Transcriptional regulator, LysR family n=1 Tax=Caballeronia arationis TaxID=1777142 RepID=A0A7Z7IDA4_9BURK|nr:LysR family transcriptional regulator [Caballeronia arationis]SOE83045.1 transcriptional regulator, LysR family [Caballeronia arationis]